MIDVNNQRLQWNELNIVQCVVFIACITCNYAINIIEMFTYFYFFSSYLQLSIPIIDNKKCKCLLQIITIFNFKLVKKICS